MKPSTAKPPTFWTTVRLLLRTTRQRASGRRERQKELLQQRSSGKSTDWSGLGFAFTVLLMAILNVGAAFVLRSAVVSGQRVETERRGKIVVSRSFRDAVTTAQKYSQSTSTSTEELVSSLDYSSEAREISDDYGGSRDAIEHKLQASVRNHGDRDFVTKDEAAPGFTDSSNLGPLPAMLGSVALLWWGAMLVFQGEGLELDLQRRRHPMWEWLFSHPVPDGAVFLAEMLSPIAANPIYWSAPLFAALSYGFVYGLMPGFLAAFMIGVPLTIAAACLGKALEIGVILRFPPRTRGAVVGFMGWIGYASMMLFLVSVMVMPKIVTAMARFLGILTVLPWPWLNLFLGGEFNGSYSFVTGMVTCWIFAGTTTAGAVWFSVWGAQQGLSGNFGRADTAPSVSRNSGVRFGKDPLYRKEFLWFTRDRSAIVQTILIPMTVAGFQLFNWRSLLSEAQSAWNYLCGAGILFGTYFLWILGPKSLASEGSALWIALTWPRGLESLLKAKAWLWSMISTGMVALVLIYAAVVFPADVWKIALVGIGWFVFGRSMAEKSVTLVTVTSSSGETEKIHWGRRWAAQLGMLTFSVGVLTQQWPIAVTGIVYSYVTAAAMWQNFRARLPYLYDPWSETLPPPPTLMHAMIAVSILAEGGSFLTGIVSFAAGRENIAIGQAISYAISAVIVSIGVSNFLSDRGVLSSDIWRWPKPGTAEEITGRWWSWRALRGGNLPLGLVAGLAGGLSLSLLALCYVALLRHLPATAEIIRKSAEQMARIPNLRLSYVIMAVLFAPFAEEYLFRGLLYRALDREWGGWRAILGSAAFFAIYHPPLSWPPVVLVGVANALLFKKTGRLAPAVVLHMIYNAVIVLT